MSGAGKLGHFGCVGAGPLGLETTSLQCRPIGYFCKMFHKLASGAWFLNKCFIGY